MRIGMVLNRVFPPDIRVEKEIGALTTAGHEVSILVYARSAAQSDLDVPVPGVAIHRISRGPLCRRGWDSLRYARTFHHPFWERQLRRFAAAERIDVLHVHDLPMLPTAQAVGRALGIPVVADLHENYPALAALWLEVASPLHRAVLPSEARWQELERRVLPLCERVIVVVDEAKRRVVEQCAVAPERVCVVMNVEDPERFQVTSEGSAAAQSRGERFVIMYTGGGGRHRGLETVIDALAQPTVRALPVDLVAVGIEPEYAGGLRDRARDLHVGDRVAIVPWQVPDAMPGYVHSGSVCIVPHLKNRHTDSTIPHKLFQYMLCGRPVLVSDCEPLRRIVEETRCGRVFGSGDSLSLANCIAELYSDPSGCAAMGAAGRRAASERYPWRCEAAKLCALYAGLNAARR